MTPKFCLLTSERTGSNFVRELLSSLPGAVFFGEVFNPVFLPKRLADLGFSQAERDPDPLGFLARLESRPIPPGSFFGFKLMIGHNPLVLNRVLSSEDYRVIVMSRANKLAQYSSLAIANTSGRWHVHKSDAAGPETKVAFDPDLFARFIARDSVNYRGVLSRLQARRQPYCHLEYTASRTPDQIAALLDFVGVKAGCTISDLIDRNPCVRQNTPRIIDRFTNPESVLATLAKLGREDWLAEAS